MDSYPIKPAKKQKPVAGARASSTTKSTKQHPAQTPAVPVANSAGQNGSSNLNPESRSSVYSGITISGTGTQAHLGHIYNPQYQYEAGAIHNQNGVVNLHQTMGVPSLASLKNRRKKDLNDAEVEHLESKKILVELKKMEMAQSNTQESYHSADSPENTSKTIKDCVERIQELEALAPTPPKEGRVAYLYNYLHASIYHLRGVAEFSQAMDIKTARFDELSAAIRSLEEVDRILAPLEISDDPYIKKRQRTTIKQLYLYAKVDKAFVDYIYAEDLSLETDETSLLKAMGRLTVAGSDMEFAEKGLKKLTKQLHEDENFQSYLEKASSARPEIETLRKLVSDAIAVLTSDEEEEDDDDSEDDSETDVDSNSDAMSHMSLKG